MTYSLVRTVSGTFTLTDAKHLASKVTADLKRCQLSYGEPNDAEINDYGTELALLLRDGFVDTYEFGFKHNEQRVVSWYYTVDSSGYITADERPGAIYTGANITGAKWFNFLSHSQKWRNLDGAARDKFREGLPFKRTSGSPPTDGHGYWTQNRTYSSTGVATIRKEFRRY